MLIFRSRLCLASSVLVLLNRTHHPLFPSLPLPNHPIAFGFLGRDDPSTPLQKEDYLYVEHRNQRQWHEDGQEDMERLVNMYVSSKPSRDLMGVFELNIAQVRDTWMANQEDRVVEPKEYLPATDVYKTIFVFDEMVEIQQKRAYHNPCYYQIRSEGIGLAMQTDRVADTQKSEPC